MGDGMDAQVIRSLCIALHRSAPLSAALRVVLVLYSTTCGCPYAHAARTQCRCFFTCCTVNRAPVYTSNTTSLFLSLCVSAHASTRRTYIYFTSTVLVLRPSAFPVKEREHDCGNTTLYDYFFS